MCESKNNIQKSLRGAKVNLSVFDLPKVRKFRIAGMEEETKLSMNSNVIQQWIP